MARSTLAGRLARAARAFSSTPRPIASITPLAGASAHLPRLAPPPAPARATARAAYSAALATRLTGDWVAGSMPPDAEIHFEARPLRARARELRRNTAVVRRYLNLFAENVLGPDGMDCQPQVRRADGTLDEPLNDYLRERWLDYCRGPVTVDGRQDFHEFSQVAITNLPCDGEFLVRKAIGRQYRYGLALQGLDADILDETKNLRPLGRENEIRMGVEIDGVGRRLAYWLRERDYLPGGWRAEPVRVTADEILHVFVAERFNQTRGVTWLAPIMNDLHQLRGYLDAHVVAARIATGQMGWLQYQKDADGPASDPNTPAEGENPTDPNAPRQPFTFEMEPGIVREVPYGMEFQAWAPEYPNTNFGEFVKSYLRWICSGLDVAYNTTCNDLEGVNLSSIRAGVLAERDHWRLQQARWIGWMQTPIYQAWLRAGYLSGAIELPTPFVERYTAVKWTPRRWPWIDPKKDIDAVERELALFLNSEENVCSEHGRDYYALLEQRASALKARREAGLLSLPEPTITKPSVTPAVERDPDEPPEDDPADA